MNCAQIEGYQIWEGKTDQAGLLSQHETPKPGWYAYRDYTAAHPAPETASVNLSTTDIMDGVNLVTADDGNTTPDTKASCACRSDTLVRWRATATMKKAPITTKKRKSGSKEGKGGGSSSRRIDARIKELSDWRDEMLTRVRALIREADPEVVEEVKWRKPSNSMLGVPVWSHAGIICTGETYKNVVKLAFAQGASLADPSGLFNSSLAGNTRRAIDFHEGDKIHKKALQSLIRAAVERNTSSAAKRPKR